MIENYNIIYPFKVLQVTKYNIENQCLLKVKTLQMKGCYYLPINQTLRVAYKTNTISNYSFICDFFYKMIIYQLITQNNVRAFDSIK